LQTSYKAEADQTEQAFSNLKQLCCSEFVRWYSKRKAITFTIPPSQPGQKYLKTSLHLLHLHTSSLV